MPSTLKTKLRSLLLDSFIWDIRQKKIDTAELEAWEAAGRPVPPPAIAKRFLLADYGATFGIRTLVETGTFLGGTMYALKDKFDTLYSIELSPTLAANAIKRFRKSPHIHILQGDSGEVIRDLVLTLNAPALFWLDGHYSAGVTALAQKETPIVQELRTLLDHHVKDHVILIDDARLFDGTHDYPTIEELRQLFLRERPDFDFSVVNDVIRAHPRMNVPTKY